ncbi:helicase C-terminal domain-containing protein [Mycolicibacterium sphagni]|uniref:helicase C-terminal domain-containing protein n=1 Tax=Mycolicibacterium sphagni TaxID=1786 RepID=UPI001F2143A9|nr:helicase C-terminal domain-containing protein [Mycolicibacterium sphagni]
MAARRLTDGARTVFSGDYLREHVAHGYAITVHSAQGTTTDTTHAVLGENTSRALFYVAMSRGRQTNTAYLTQQPGRDGYASHGSRPDVDGESRHTSQHAAQLVRGVIANDRDQTRTAHDVAEEAPGNSAAPGRVSSLRSRRQRQITYRSATDREWQHTRLGAGNEVHRGESQSRQAGLSDEIGL